MKSEHVTIKTNDLREWNFYWRELKKKGWLPMIDPPTSTQNFYDKINQILLNHFRNETEKELFIAKLKSKFEENIVAKKNLEWITSGSDRMCFWVWSFLRLGRKSEGWIPLVQDLSQKELNRPYSALQLAPYPTNSNDRLNAIIEFMDQAPFKMTEKQEILRELQAKWPTVIGKFSFSWVNTKDKELCAWLWRYISTSEELEPFSWYLGAPYSSQQQFDFAVNLFDVWNALPDTKELFTLKMKKAWSQKKHRRKMDSSQKKSYSFTISKDTKSKLDLMALESGMRKNELLELMIQKEFSNFKARN